MAPEDLFARGDHRTEVERALRASEERYRRITEAITDYTFTVRVEGGRAVETRHSPACEAVTGYRSEDYADDPSLWYRMVYPEDRALVEDQARRALASEDAPAIEHRLVRKDGAIRWVRNTLVPHRDGEGRLLGYDGVVTDVTERRSAEEALRKREQEFVTLVENAQDPIVRLDRDLRYVYCNAAASRTLGVPTAGLAGRRVGGLTTATLPASIDGALRRALDLGELAEFEQSVPLPGGVRHFLIRIVPERDATGRIETLLATARDITERKGAEQALRDSEEKFSKAFRAAPVSMSIIALDDGTFLDANDEGLRVSGFSREEVVGSRIGETGWITTRDRSRLIGILRQEGRVAGLDMAFRTKSGREILGLVRGEKIVVDGRECLLAAMVDVTERRRAEEDRLALERQVLHTQKLESLGVLAGGIAHDFNNLLVAILGNASLARVGLQDDAPLAGSLRDIEAAARRASELCGQLLAYSGRGTFLVEPVDLNRVIEEMVNLIRVSVSKKADLRLELLPSALPIEADATQLRQIVLNLVVNASEAIGDADGLITVSTGTADPQRDGQTEAGTADELPAGRCAYLEVADTGSGMDAETRRRLFEPFFSTKFAGRGLGLSAVLGIVRGHKGVVRVTSTPGRGSVFRIFFPLLDDAPVLSPSAGPAGEAGRWQREGTVLVVDDDASVRSVAARMLERHGLSVRAAADGREGVQVLRQHASEVLLVLLDLTMPRLAGGEALREIRELSAHLPVVLMSGYGESEAARLMAGQQVQAFLQKPFDEESLTAALRKAFAAAPAAPAAPVAAALDSPAGGASSAHPAPTGEPARARILLVDDDAQVRGVGRAVLEHLGHTVHTAGDGGQALAEYQRLRGEVDLVILDQRMPVLSGEDTFRALRQEDPGILVLFASGNLAPDTTSGLRTLGAAGFVQKPYTIGQLKQAVATALRGRTRTL